ncbi:MAG: hypothetical protein HON53_03215 [Planctomycetaceae bacterium]|jgi:hypothetical protein|nr:hypothetical protein [Planctomycetaceae bacterium]MBT6156270.1 hypothetical protein [Planctomycetaceae bacterium]MBT6483932.1 hypothetical protein [Planctomycetaceae bacterium]MBT6494838.1 hypothetical protein [Planctomycetaceae bacterium]
MQHKFRVLFSFVVLAGAMTTTGFAAEKTEALLKTIKSVGDRGQGNLAATRAQRALSKVDAAELPTILQAFKGADPLASNWLRGAVESIADRELKQGGKLPVSELVAFVVERKNVPRARRLAFELLQRVDGKKAESLVPAMLDDPSPELRREAVSRLIDAAKGLEDEGNKEGATTVYSKALSGAVEDDQVKAIVAPLKKLGTKVDLPRHFGFLTQWSIVGPFDNRDRVGFAAVYPPEKSVDLKASYKGQLGDVKWAPISTGDDYGLVDIAKKIKNYKGSTMYATADFFSDRKQTVEIRIGTPNSWKLWVNGKLKFAREEYHRGMKLDQYKVQAIELEPGRNAILFKICQNEQTDSWAQRYQFQIRVCDTTGTAILSDDKLRTSLREQPTSKRRLAVK